MFGETVAAATNRRAPLMLVTALVIAAVLGLGPATAAAQGPPDDVHGVGPVVLDGELEVLYEDYEDQARLVHFLHANKRRIPLKFNGRFAPDLKTGSRVRVRGNLADGTVTATTVETLAVSTSWTTGSPKVIVVLFNFSNNPTEAFAESTITSVNDSVRDYYLENTYGQTELSFAVSGWYTIAATDSGCDYYTWTSLAEAAATEAGVDLSAYDRRVFAFPRASSCAWNGMGNLGGVRSWSNGSYSVRTIAHEQGHNFGDHHSKALNCHSTSCTTVEYGDDRDVMGKTGVVGHMNAFQKERVGWLNYGSAPSIQTVTTSGDYWIGNYVSLSGDPKALKIWSPANNGYYYVESRANAGFDANIASGVTLHLGVSGISYQIDLDPITSTYDSTLDPGQTFTDSAMALSIETLSTSVDGALIRVNLGNAPCRAQAPSVSLAPSGLMQYSVTVKNNSDSSCNASMFTAAAAVPSGWTAAFSPASSVSLAPGSSASLMMTLAAPAGTFGTYAFTVSGTDGTTAKFGSATASVTLAASSLEVTAAAAVEPGKGKKQLALIVVRARSETQAMAGAAVAVVITNPKGATMTLNATAGSDGTATVKVSLKPKDPSGVYQVRATATSSGATGQATTSFTAP